MSLIQDKAETIVWISHYAISPKNRVSPKRLPVPMVPSLSGCICLKSITSWSTAWGPECRKQWNSLSRAPLVSSSSIFLYSIACRLSMPPLWAILLLIPYTMVSMYLNKGETCRSKKMIRITHWAEVVRPSEGSSWSTIYLQSNESFYYIILAAIWYQIFADCGP